MVGPGSGRPKKEFSKGSKSKTHPGEKDFTTKKGSKDFDRGGHRSKHAEGSKKKRAPYTSKRGGSAEHMKKMRDAKKTSKKK